jgi:anti-sigma B factor antagonist
MEELVGASTPGLRVEIFSDDAGVEVLKIIGELDLASVDSLHASTDAIVNQEPSEIVFDLSDLQFMDSSGIAFFVTVAQRIGIVELRDPRPMIRRIIQLTGLTGVFRITP